MRRGIRDGLEILTHSCTWINVDKCDCTRCSFRLQFKDECVMLPLLKLKIKWAWLSGKTRKIFSTMEEAKNRKTFMLFIVCSDFLAAYYCSLGWISTWIRVKQVSFKI